MSYAIDDRERELEIRRDILDIFRSAVAECDAQKVTDRAFDVEGRFLWIRDQRFRIPEEGIIVLGAGKVSGIMAEPLLAKAGSFIRRGLISTLPCWAKNIPNFELFGAGHPLPDPTGLAAGRSMEKMLWGLKARHLFFFLLSGGASALLPSPPGGVGLEDKIRMTDLLLKSGADIHEINCVRKHLSRIKGGGLAKLVCPKPLITLSISDVPDDDPASIGSGPTVPDPTTFSQSLGVVRKYGLEDKMPPAALQYLLKGSKGLRPETPKPGDPVFSGTKYFTICSGKKLIEAARLKSSALGYHTFVLKEGQSGDVRDVARLHLKILRRRVEEWEGKVPLCLISSGEATVNVTGKGKGGRNQEFVLTLVEEISAMQGICVLSGATDGMDGPTGAAGAVADGSTMTRAQEAGLHPEPFLSRNDSYHFFEPLGDLIVTGPGRTNVMDLRVLIFSPDDRKRRR